MKNTEITNVEIFIEYINTLNAINNREKTLKMLSDKYNFNTSVIEAMISYGREEHGNTEYWNNYLKPILQN